MLRDHPIEIFALGASREYGQRVAERLGVPLGPVEEREFEDGEHKVRPLVDVRGRHAVAIHALYGDPQQSANDKLCRLLFFVGALKESGAARVSVVAPYLCYARKDRQTKPRDPVTTKYVARLFEAVGADSLLTLDVHNLAAFQNAFRCETVHVEAEPLFVEHFAPQLRGEAVTVISPDVGGTKRAEAFRRALAARIDQEPRSGFMEKQRSGGIVSGDTLIGEVRDRVVVILDDMISSGTTLQRAAAACRRAGAARVHATATHGLFTANWRETLGDPAIDSLTVVDTIPASRVADSPVARKLTVLDSTGLVAAAISPQTRTA
ncbi:MAG TPA: ribose-phosphate diphosphokinase [Dongiaceae bacterium]|jgi:ribose-phosphate pyrophosphokinase|nr:ribose-phosphate diphosphokinase [Dongiaceae bacterium]